MAGVPDRPLSAGEGGCTLLTGPVPGSHGESQGPSGGYLGAVATHGVRDTFRVCADVDSAQRFQHPAAEHRQRWVRPIEPGGGRSRASGSAGGKGHVSGELMG